MISTNHDDPSKYNIALAFSQTLKLAKALSIIDPEKIKCPKFWNEFQCLIMKENILNKLKIDDLNELAYVFTQTKTSNYGVLLNLSERLLLETNFMTKER